MKTKPEDAYDYRAVVKSLCDRYTAPLVLTAVAEAVLPNGGRDMPPEQYRTARLFHHRILGAVQDHLQVTGPQPPVCRHDVPIREGFPCPWCEEEGEGT